MTDCKCKECKGACEYKPGWFTPGQVEKVAEFLDISLQDLFNTKLGIDWWVGGFSDDDKDTFILAPAILGMGSGNEYPADPRGQCVFYKNGLCSIHLVKPFECAEYDHTHNQVGGRHESVARKWKDHQSQIVKLLEREPESMEFGGIFGMLGLGSWD